MKFEDLKAWQKARELTNAVYQMCREKPLSHDYSLRDQVQRAAVSVMNNLAEGFDRMHKTEKLNFYNIAKGSSGEVRSICYVIQDKELASKSKVDFVQLLASEASALIHGLMKSTRG
ncbi:MAG: hypothetical protein RLZZ408_118 [Verrucomicrobiota bacterium]|jgi:four helix bundle protein